MSRVRIQPGLARVGDNQLRPAFGGLLDPQPPDGCLFMKIGRDHQDRIPLPQLAEIGPRIHPKLPHQVSAGHPVIQHRRAPQPFNECTEVEQVFVRQPSACQPQQSSAQLAESLGCPVECLFPGGLDQFPILPDERLGQPVETVSVVVGKAALVANPDLVYQLVLPRHDPFDGLSPIPPGRPAGIEGQIAADRTVRTDGGG